MTVIQKCAWGYAILFFIVVSLGYIPGFTDEQGLLFGSFKIDFIDDVLHAVSGIWAAWAAWHSPKQARFYFQAFGTFYTADAFLGFFTGYAFVDFLTLNFSANAGHSLSHLTTNLLVNLPHFILGPLALIFGFLLPKTAYSSKKK